MKNSKKITVLLLAAVMVIPLILTACQTGGGGNKPAETTVPAEFTLPTADYGEHEFNILYVGRGSVMTNDFTYTENSSVLDNAKYKRNSAVETQYNIKIKTDERTTTKNQQSPEAYSALVKEKTSGDYTFDAAIIPGYDVSELAYLGYLYDLNSLPVVDFDNSWWDQKANDEFTIKDCLFFTTGDYGVSMMDQTYCIAFNKDLHTTLNMPDLYKTVEDGEWTIDKFIELSSGASQDLDGDLKISDTDRVGVLWWDDTIYGVVNSAGGRLCTVEDDGTLSLTLKTERVSTMIDKYMDLLLNTDAGLRYAHNSPNREFVSIFGGDHAVFFMTTIGHLSYIRDMKTDYGILPYFKLDKEQAEYETTVAPFYMTYLCVPYFVEDAERTGTILEAIGYISQKEVRPAYYEKTLVGQYVRDDQSVATLDIIFAGRAYDYGYCYQPANLNKELIYMLRDRKTNDFVSTYDSFEQKAIAALETISTSYAEVVASWQDQ